MHGDEVYWFGSYLQLLVMIALLVYMWFTKNCSGISLKSQILYALVFTARHQDLDGPYLPAENVVLKITYIIVTYGTVLSMLLYFRKTYEKQNDTAKIGIFIISSVVISIFLNERFTVLDAFMAFSMCLETVAMLPQFELFIKTKQIHKHVVLYIVAMGVYTILYCLNFSQMYRDRYHLRIAAGVIQLLLYCDFFHKIYPKLLKPEYEIQNPTDADIQKAIPETGHFADNVSKIVLTPAKSSWSSQ